MPKAQTRRYSNVLANRKSVVTLPRQVNRVGRNDPCPCGSGKKYKNCHANEGEAFLHKLARKQEKQQLKQQGRSWLLRFFK